MGTHDHIVQLSTIRLSGSRAEMTPLHTLAGPKDLVAPSPAPLFPRMPRTAPATRSGAGSRDMRENPEVGSGPPVHEGSLPAADAGMMPEVDQAAGKTGNQAAAPSPINQAGRGRSSYSPLERLLCISSAAQTHRSLEQQKQPPPVVESIVLHLQQELSLLRLHVSSLPAHILSFPALPLSSPFPWLIPLSSFPIVPRVLMQEIAMHRFSAFLLGVDSSANGMSDMD